MEGRIMKTKTAFSRGNLPETFEELCKLHMLRPINDKVGFVNAQEVADALAVLDRRTPDQDEYLESLSVLMEHYENSNSPINRGNLTQAEVLRYLMESREMSESDLGRLLGERSLGNAILAGRRALSKANIRALADHFKVSTDLFL
jgi:antitoxin component HigA of HigAB toxin-antitoxin module